MSISKDQFKSGFISVIGRPNVGKSTIVNSIVGRKVSAVSNKPNTTRNKILGIKTYSDSQLIFLDTPGIHKAKGSLGKSMVHSANSAASESDLIMFVTDTDRFLGREDLQIVQNISRPSIMVLNKIDKINKSRLLPMLTQTNEIEKKFLEIIPVSALKNDGLDILADALKKYLKPGPKHFPDELFTDQPEIFYVGELIREKVFILTHKEVPYKAAVKVEEFKENPEKNIIRISANIYVERKSHKGIIIGKNGEMLKQIGTDARVEIESILGTKIFLELWVKVKENWTQNKGFLKDMGYGN
ncbi:MAG: GTPase Era [Thermodesulfobacteriota bacterium]